MARFCVHEATADGLLLLHDHGMVDEAGLLADLRAIATACGTGLQRRPLAGGKWEIGLDPAACRLIADGWIAAGRPGRDPAWSIAEAMCSPVWMFYSAVAGAAQRGVGTRAVYEVAR